MCEISVAPELLEAIAGDYERSARIIEDFINHQNNTRSGLDDNYEGHASSDLVPSTFSKIREHLELLQICCTSVQSYVTDAKEQMVEGDIRLSNSFGSVTSATKTLY